MKVQKALPDGYRMAFIPRDQVETCAPLLHAFDLNKKLKAEAEAKDKTE